MSDEKRYVLFDGRAMGASGTDDAWAHVLCKSDACARSYAGDYGAMACYSYKVEKHEGRADRLIDERWEWDWRPSSGFSDQKGGS